VREKVVSIYCSISASVSLRFVSQICRQLADPTENQTEATAEQVLVGRLEQINRWRGESTATDNHVNVVPAILPAIYMRCAGARRVSLVCWPAD